MEVNNSWVLTLFMYVRMVKKNFMSDYVKK